MKELNRADWDTFCKLVKYKRRYFFHNIKVQANPFLYGQSVVEETATRLCKYVFVLKKDTSLFRCRPEPKNFETSIHSKELGPPPPTSARANRMSAAGISMFYFAESKDTALLETADRPGEFGIAEFRINRDLALIDLADLDQIDDKQFVEFLNAVVTDMTKPIKRDDRVHVEYIPTQIAPSCSAITGSTTTTGQ